MEAALLTDNLRKLVLYEPPIPLPIGSAISPPGALTLMESLLAAGDQEGVMLTFARDIARLPENEITAVRSSPAWPIAVAYAPAIIEDVRAIDTYVFEAAHFSRLATPTLLLTGSESPPYLQAASEAVTAALPHSRPTVLSGQAHLAMFTAPDLFLREVVQFLTE